MVKEIYFYCLVLDPMVLQVTGASCMNVGYNYVFVSGVDHLWFKFGRATKKDAYATISDASILYYMLLGTTHGVRIQ
jgi:hypothetical protein